MSRIAPAPSHQGEKQLYGAFESAWDELSLAVRRARGKVAQGLHELSVPQYLLVEGLEGGRTKTVGQAAEAAGVAGPTATRMLDGLERAGLVVRQHSRTDRRVVEVRLTAEGERLVADKRRALRTVRREAFDSLTEEERTCAPALLSKIADAMDRL
jgi:DNA-binding MarR family transcriptional regulator